MPSLAKRSAVIFGAVLVGLALAAGLFAVQARAAEAHTGDEVEIEGAFDDMVFAAGGKVGIRADVGDDVFAAGGEIRFTGGTADHLITGGGEVTLDGVAVEDVIASGGKLRFENVRISDDLVAAGGEITIDENTTIAGSVMAATGRFVLDGSAGGTVRVAAGEVEIRGTIKGNAHVTAGHLIIHPSAKLEGDLSYRARKADISPEAEIAGAITVLELPPGKGDWRRTLIGGAVAFFLFFLLGSIVLALALVALLPRVMDNTAQVLRQNPLSCAGAGVLWSLLLPLVIGLLMLTVLGVPLALFLIPVFLLAIPLGSVVFAHFIGRLIRTRTRPEDGRPPIGPGGRVAWALLGVVILAVVMAIPVLGPFVCLITYLFGAGALVLLFVRTRHEYAEVEQ